MNTSVLIFAAFRGARSHAAWRASSILVAGAILAAAVPAQRSLYRYSVVRTGVLVNGTVTWTGWFNNRNEFLLQDNCGSGCTRYSYWSPRSGRQPLPTTCPNEPTRHPQYLYLNNQGQLVASGCTTGAPQFLPTPYLCDLSTSALTPVLGGPACASGASIYALNDAAQFVVAQCQWYLGSTTASYQALNLGSYGAMQVDGIFLSPTGTVLWNSWNGTATHAVLMSVGAPPRLLLPQATSVQGAGFIGSGELSVLYWSVAGANHNGIVDGQGNVRVQFGPYHYISGLYDSVNASEQAVCSGRLNAASTTGHLWLYQDGALTNIERLMVNPGCWLNSALAINDSGMIFGDCTIGGVRELVLLQPGTQPSLALHVEPGTRTYTSTPPDPRYHIPLQTQSITLHLTGGKAGQPVGIFVTDPNGIPYVPALGITLAAADGTYTLPVAIPPGLRGDIPLKAYGYDPAYGVLDALPLVLAFP